MRSKNERIPKCETHDEEYCASEASKYFHDYVFELEEACDILEFFGPELPENADQYQKQEMIGTNTYWLPNNTFMISIGYDRPAVIKVEEEFLIYDFVAMVGSVGGTLGMFIGFSFTNMISLCISGIKMLIEMISRKTARKSKIDDVEPFEKVDNEEEQRPNYVLLLERIESIEKKMQEMDNKEKVQKSHIPKYTYHHI